MNDPISNPRAPFGRSIPITVSSMLILNYRSLNAPPKNEVSLLLTGKTCSNCTASTTAKNSSLSVVKISQHRFSTPFAVQTATLPESTSITTTARSVSSYDAKSATTSSRSTVIIVQKKLSTGVLFATTLFISGKNPKS